MYRLDVQTALSAACALSWRLIPSSQFLLPTSHTVPQVSGLLPLTSQLLTPASWFVHHTSYRLPLASFLVYPHKPRGLCEYMRTEARAGGWKCEVRTKKQATGP